MLRQLKTKIEEQDSYEVRTGLVFLWLFAFAIFGFVWSVKQNLDWVWFACAAFALASLVNALYWFSQPRTTTAHCAPAEDECADDDAAQEDECAPLSAQCAVECAAECAQCAAHCALAGDGNKCAQCSAHCAVTANDVDTSAHDASPATAHLTPQELTLRANFYAFVYHVCNQHIVGEGAWKKRGLSVPTYQRWIKILKEVKVVSTPPAGAAPTVLMGLEEALAALAAWGGEPGYWQPVLNYYQPKSGGTTLLMMQDPPA